MLKKNQSAVVHDVISPSRWGWTREWLDRFQLHKGITALGSVAVSAMVSLGLSGAGKEVNPPFGVTITREDEVLQPEWHQTSTTRDADETTITVTPLGEAPHVDVPTTVMVENTRMPASYDLLLNSDAERQILNSQEFTAFLDSLAVRLNNGAVIKDVSVAGFASGEVNHLGGAQLREENLGNTLLAQQRAEFTKSHIANELLARGVSQDAIDNMVFSLSGAEVNLSQYAIDSLDSIRANHGMNSIGDMIRLHEEGPADIFSLEEKAVMYELLDVNRGAEITITFYDELNVPMLAEKTVTVRCVNETIIETTITYNPETKTTTYTIVLIPLPWVRLTRRRNNQNGPASTDLSGVPLEAGEIEESEGVPTGQPDEAPGAAAAEPEQESGNDSMPAEPLAPEQLHPYESLPTSNSRYIRSLISDLQAHITNLKKYQTGTADQNDYVNDKIAIRMAELEILQNKLKSYEEATKNERRMKRLGKVMLAAVLIPLAFVRFDAGYCPDTDELADQPYDIHEGLFPDRLDIGFGLTDMKYRAATLWNSECGDPQEAAPTDLPPPTCDARVIEIVNGKTVDVRETHYLGAVTTTQTIIEIPQ